MRTFLTLLLMLVCTGLYGGAPSANFDLLTVQNRLGVKTNSPKQPLHVNGDARIEGSAAIRGYLGLGTNNYQAKGLTIWHDSPSVDLWDRDTNILWSTKNYTGELCFIGGMANVDAHYVMKLSTNGDIASQVGRFVGNGSGLTNLNWIWRTNWAGHNPSTGTVDWTNQNVGLYLLSGGGAGISKIVLGQVAAAIAGQEPSSPYLILDAGSGVPARLEYKKGNAGPQTFDFIGQPDGYTNMWLSDSNLTILGHMTAKSFSGDGSLVTNLPPSSLVLGDTNTVLAGTSSNAAANSFRGDVAITNLVAYGHKSDLTAIVYGVDTDSTGIYTRAVPAGSYTYAGPSGDRKLCPPNGPNTNYWRIGAGTCPDVAPIYATNTTATLDDNTWTNVSDGLPAAVWIPQDKPSVAADGDVIVNRFLGVGTNNPLSGNANSLATFRADGGGFMEIFGANNSEPTISMLDSTGAKSVTIGVNNDATALGYISTDYGYFDLLADYSADDSEPDIDVGFHILTDSAGSLPLWTVLGSMLVTNSIIATNAYGTNEISLPYANYSCSADQLVTNVATTNIVVFTDVDSANRITPLTDPGTWSKTYIQEAGAYQIIVSAIADSSGSTAPNIHMTLWLAVNGVIGGGGSVPRSATTVAIPDANSEHTLVVAFNYVFAQGDYFELWYSGEDADMLFNATAAGGTPVKPASPSIIMTVNKISSVP